MKLFFVLSIFFLGSLSCSQSENKNDIHNTDNKKHELKESKEEPQEQQRTEDFYCEIDGKVMQSNKRYCIRKPQFSHYDFWFIGSNVSGDLHITLDFSLEGKSVPFKIEMTKEDSKSLVARIHYEVPPEGYFVPKELNTITVTAWDKEKKTISMDFEGYVGDTEGTKYYHVKGYLNNLTYESFD